MNLPWFGNFDNWPTNLPIQRWADNVTATPPLLEQYSVPDFRIGYETPHNIYLQVEEE